MGPRGVDPFLRVCFFHAFTGVLLADTCVAALAALLVGPRMGDQCVCLLAPAGA